MTYKAAAAGLDLGGGKGVICAPDAAPPQGELRRAILHDFGDLVESLGRPLHHRRGRRHLDRGHGRDRDAHHPRDRDAGRAGGAGDPSPFTAAGVQAAMRAACRRAFGTGDLAGRSVAVVGLGHVGERLARGLDAAGARARARRHRPREAGRRRGARRRVARARRRARRGARRRGAVRGRRGDQRRQRRRAALPRRLRRGEQPARRRAAGQAPRPARDPLRPRLHRQRRRPDQRLPRAARLRRSSGRRPWCSGSSR